MVQVEAAATVQVQLTVGGAGLTTATFTPALRAAFVEAVAARLGVDPLRVELLQAS